MTENFTGSDLTEEEIQKRVRSLSYRNPFQILVFKKLGIQDDVEKVIKDRKIISDYIDNPDNVEVRRLISLGKDGFEAAADILIAEIKKTEESQKAA